MEYSKEIQDSLYETCKKLQSYIIKTRQPSFSHIEEAESVYKEIFIGMNKALKKAEGKDG